MLALGVLIRAGDLRGGEDHREDHPFVRNKYRARPLMGERRAEDVGRVDALGEYGRQSRRGLRDRGGDGGYRGGRGGERREDYPFVRDGYRTRELSAGGRAEDFRGFDTLGESVGPRFRRGLRD